MLENSDLHSIAHGFRPRQLTLAREVRGLLKHELAEKIQKTPSAVGQFENGRSRPDPSTIFSLSLALGVPAAFFAREPVAEAVRPDACQFRSLRSCTVREQRYVAVERASPRRRGRDRNGTGERQAIVIYSARPSIDQ